MSVNCSQSLSTLYEEQPHHNSSEELWVDQTIAVSSLIIGVFAVVSNLYIMLVLVQDKKTQSSLLFINMAITDVLAGLCNLFLGYFLFTGADDAERVNIYLCSVLGFTFNSISIMTPVLLCLISTLRFIGLWFPNMYQRRELSRTFTVVMLASWTAVSIIMVLISVGADEVYKYTHPFCDIKAAGRYVPARTIYRIFFTVFIVSIIVIPGMSGGMLYKLIAYQPQHIPTNRPSFQITPTMQSSVHKLAHRKRQKATLMTLLFTLNYVVFYMYQVVYFVLPILQICQVHSLSDGARWLSHNNATAGYYLNTWYYYSVFSNASTNSLIHITCNGKVRCHMRGVVRSLLGKYRTSLREVLKKPRVESETTL